VIAPSVVQVLVDAAGERGFGRLCCRRNPEAASPSIMTLPTSNAAN
jgi:hypothetical protein